MDVLGRTDLPFPQSLPEFQRLFPDDGACAAYLERIRWGDGFACPHCGIVGEPFRIATRPGVLTCRACRRQTGLTVGTVMERSHTPLSTWFWAAYLVASQTQACRRFSSSSLAKGEFGSGCLSRSRFSEDAKGRSLRLSRGRSPRGLSKRGRPSNRGFPSRE